MITIEALRLKIDTLQFERQQFESQNLKLYLENNCYKEEHEHLTVENERLQVASYFYDELLKKTKEEGDKAIYQCELSSYIRSYTAAYNNFNLKKFIGQYNITYIDHGYDHLACDMVNSQAKPWL